VGGRAQSLSCQAKKGSLLLRAYAVAENGITSAAYCVGVRTKLTLCALCNTVLAQQMAIGFIRAAIFVSEPARRDRNIYA
jgi:hypothetical protein